MQLSNINNSKQYFGAQYVTKVQAEKYSNDEESYVPSKLPVVELDLLNKKDVRALKELNLFWQGSDYIMNICYDVNRVYNINQDNERTHLYAITTQKADFENLRSDEILGIAETKHPNINEPVSLEYIQVSPDLQGVFYPSEYKHIGTAMLNFLKDRCKNKKIILTSAVNASKFYEKNGFKKLGTKNRYVWNG